LRVEISFDHTVIAIDALALPFRFDLRETLLSRGMNVTSQRVKTADQRAVRMNAASLGIQEDAGPVFFPIQYSSTVVGVAFNEPGSGQTAVYGKARDFIRVDLNLLVAAAKKTLRTREEKRRFPIQSCSAQW
jgi:hypothetical protein